MPIDSTIAHCPICTSSIKSWRTKFVGNDKYNLDLCRSCGYSFVNPRPSLSFLMEYYSSFGQDHDLKGKEPPSLQSVLIQEQNYPNATLDSRRIISTTKSLLNNISNVKLLDVGCGYGFFSREALYSGFDVTALELAKNERDIAKEMTGLNPVSSSFEEFECAPGSFSVVLMSQILEHALDVNFWIKKSHNLLVKNGVLAIALPNFGSIFRMVMQENEPFICPPAHLNFFNPNSLALLLNSHGFKVEAIQWVSRIPNRAIEKRLPFIRPPFLPAISMASSATLRVIDRLRLGMIINVYGRKL